MSCKKSRKVKQVQQEKRDAKNKQMQHRRKDASVMSVPLSVGSKSIKLYLIHPVTSQEVLSKGWPWQKCLQMFSFFQYIKPLAYPLSLPPLFHATQLPCGVKTLENKRINHSVPCLPTLPPTSFSCNSFHTE